MNKYISVNAINKLLREGLSNFWFAKGILNTVQLLAVRISFPMRGLSKAPIKEKIKAPPKNTSALTSRLYKESNNKKVEMINGDITPVKFMIPKKSNFIPEPRVDPVC